MPVDDDLLSRRPERVNESIVYIFALDESKARGRCRSKYVRDLVRRSWHYGFRLCTSLKELTIKRFYVVRSMT